MPPISRRLLDALGDPAALVALAPTEWEPLLSCARRNTVLAYLGALSAQAGVLDRFPAMARRAIESTMCASARRAQLARWEVEQLRRVLVPLGVPMIALKGAAYVLRGMRHGATRPMSDVDVMVPRDMLDVAEAALLGAGWRGTNLDPYDQAYYRRWSHELPPLQYPGRVLSVDVHHTICPPVSRLRPDPARFWANAQPSGVEGVQLLSPADSVLHAAVHLFFDSDFDGRFRDLVDIDEMIVAFEPDRGFWPALVEAARAQGLDRPLYYAAVTRECILGKAAPPEALAALAAARAAAPVDVWMRGTLEVLLTPTDPAVWPAAHGFRRWLMFVRSHWLRMPPHLLLPHLLRKALRRKSDEAPAPV